MKKLVLLSFAFYFYTLSSLQSQSYKELSDSSKYYIGKEDYKVALKWVNLALIKAEKDFGRNDTNFLSSLDEKASIFFKGRKYDSALFYQKIYYDICKNLYKFENKQKINSICNLAEIYYELKDLKNAELYSIEAYEMNKKLMRDSNQSVFKAFSQLAFLYKKMNNFSLAENIYLEEIEARKKMLNPDLDGLSKAFNVAGIFYFDIGNLFKAKEYYLEALNLAKKVNKEDNDQVASELLNLGNVYTLEGDYKKAEPYFIESLEITKRIIKGDDNDIAITLNSLGYFYSMIGEFIKSEKYYKEAIEMISRIDTGDSYNKALYLNNLGTLYQNMESYKKAEEILIEVVQISRRLFNGDHPSLAFFINNLGMAYQSTGEPEKAINLVKDAVEMKKRLSKNDSYGLALFTNNLGYLYYLNNDSVNAEFYLNDAYNMYRRIYNSGNYEMSRNLSTISRLYLKRNNFKKSEDYYLELIEMTKGIIEKNFPILSEKEKANYWKKYNNYFEGFNSFAIQSSNKNPKILCNMYNNQIEMKSLLYNSANKIKNRILNSNDSILKALFNELNQTNIQLLKYYSSTKDELNKKNIKIDSVEEIKNSLEKKISIRSEDFALLNEKKKIDWKSIQNKLKKDEVAIEVIRFRFVDLDKFTDTIHYAFLIINNQTKEYPELVLLENGKELENRYYNDYRRKIKSKIDDDKSFNQYWKKLYDKIKKYKKVYFSPDGIYNKINPETLLMPNGKYLFEIQEIEQINCTKDIIIGMDRKNSSKSKAQSAVLVGNPNFSLSESMITANIQKLNSKENYNKGYELFASRGNQLTKLPGTAKEINEIESLLNQKNIKVDSYMGDMALKTAVKSVNNPTILHIATHGMFLQDVKISDEKYFGINQQKLVENPLLRSGLFFTGADNYLDPEKQSNDVEDNGVLTAFEAMNLDLDKTELVVLSACETGLGEVVNGEGVYGLKRAFQQAGAKSIIMSLWTVDDNATQELMTAFYKNWLTGQSKREAFSKAQTEIKTKYNDPYYWGAFVMVGE